MAERIGCLLPPSTAAERTDELARKCDVIESKVDRYFPLIEEKDLEVNRLRRENAEPRALAKELAEWYREACAWCYGDHVKCSTRPECLASLLLDKAKGNMR